MHAEYKKEWMDTYLWILKENETENFFEEEMLQYNREAGRLEFSKRQENGQEYYCYKITGKKPLNGIYAMMAIGEHQIRRILHQIFEILEQGKEYLLSENDFVLLPNYIFATLPKLEIDLCYIPGYRIPLKEQLEGFLEYLLNRVDYEDKKAVELLYECYMFCVKEKGSWQEIRALVEENQKGEEIGEEKKEEYIPVRSRETGEENDKQEVQAQESATSYVSWLADRFFHKKKREALMVAEQREEYHAGKGKEKKPVSEPAEEDEERTEFLSVTGRGELPQLVNERTGEVFLLQKFPFYIGSVGKYADCVAEEPGVSRIHCCINKKEEKYYLSDLNSTNGTYLDEKEVLPGTDVRLQNGAVIRVAKTEFYVKLPCH